MDSVCRVLLLFLYRTRSRVQPVLANSSSDVGEPKSRKRQESMRNVMTHDQRRMDGGSGASFPLIEFHQR
jgi:hypothetical protein